MQFARQHAKVRDFTSRHACLEVKFGFRQVKACFIGGSLPVILSSMGLVCMFDQLTFLLASLNSEGFFKINVMKSVRKQIEIIKKQ